MTTQKEPSFADVSRELDQRMTGADTLRADKLDALTVARAVKHQGLGREQARLAQKLGPTHPRVTEIDGRLTLNANMVRDLKIESARARTEVPQIDAKTWVLHGYVRDQNLTGVPNLTVVLDDQNARRIETLGHACTAANGYFKLSSQQVNATGGGQAYLRVLSAQGTYLYVDQNALTPLRGTLDYREIILSGETTVCAAPPPAPPPPAPTSTSTPPTTVAPIAASSPDQTQDLTPPRGFWVVRGRVTSKAGTGLGGLFVSVYDEDLFFDDRLGQTETDQNGNYSLTYRADDFRDLIEKKPDLYLKVVDGQGRVLHVLKGHIWYESGRVENIDIEID